MNNSVKCILYTEKMSGHQRPAPSTKYQFVFFFLFSFLLPFVSSGQTIFSEEEFEFKKIFLPYDVAYTLPLEDKEFVMLKELKKNTMKLGRYDQYLFEKWEKEIEFKEDESAPQVFIKGDTIVAFSLTSLENKNQIRITFQYYDLKSGEESAASNYVFSIEGNEGYSPKISFSDDRSKFVIYNYLVAHDNSNKAEFQIFETGSEKPLKQYYLDPQKLTPSKSNTVHLSDDGDLLLVVVEAVNFKAETYFWSSKSSGVKQINNNFFFERPVDNIAEINIVRQSVSSYFVSFAAMIEEELIGFNVTGINVVLKTVMFSYNQNFRKDEIQSVYENYYITSQNQKKKYLEVPETLEEFRLVSSFVNTYNDIILLFENLEKASNFHENAVSNNMPWKHKSKEDKFYFGGDILLYCFTESGEIKWKKTIQKTQFSQGNTLGLSFLPRMNNDELKLLLYESSKGGNFYILDINTIDGTLTKTTNLLPDKKFEFTKKYSCWLNDNTVIISGISPTNINKRTMMLVEF